MQEYLLIRWWIFHDFYKIPTKSKEEEEQQQEQFSHFKDRGLRLAVKNSRNVKCDVDGDVE